jgi:hypothetical protein
MKPIAVILTCGLELGAAIGMLGALQANQPAAGALPLWAGSNSQFARIPMGCRSPLRNHSGNDQLDGACRNGVIRYSFAAA